MFGRQAGGWGDRRGGLSQTYESVWTEPVLLSFLLTDSFQLRAHKKTYFPSDSLILFNADKQPDVHIKLRGDSLYSLGPEPEPELSQFHRDPNEPTFQL